MALRNTIAALLRKTPLFMHAREIYTTLSPSLRALRRVERDDLKRITCRVGNALQLSLVPSASPPRTVLIMGMGRVRFIAQEAVIRKSFELAGYRCAVLIPQDRMVMRAYQQLGSDELIFFDHYQAAAPQDGGDMIANCSTLDSVTAFTVNGVRCGKYAVSTLMRKTRTGAFDLSQPSVREELARALNRSLQCAHTAQVLIDHIRPEALVLVDRGYSPSGELFDTCIERGIPVFTWNAAHKNDTLMLKRYTAANRDVHPSSLSEDTWRALCAMPWTSEHSAAVRTELERCYASGEWYAEVGTQFNKKAVDKATLVSWLGLDPSRKTAVIFPHIFWDATFFWGKDLFENYEEWFIQTVQAACHNDRLNWIIKVHPANLVKNRRDGVMSEHSEIAAIRKAVGELPPHVKIMQAETEISTLSLFNAIDCCVTVRGTVGIEAACFGVPVLTAGTGRYDRLGFTIDSDSREEYLDHLANAHNIAMLSPLQSELALRHAWGVLLARPARLQLVRMRYLSNETADLEIDFQVHTAQQLHTLSDLHALSSWIENGVEDYVQL